MESLFLTFVGGGGGGNIAKATTLFAYKESTQVSVRMN